APGARETDSARRETPAAAPPPMASAAPAAAAAAPAPAEAPAPGSVSREVELLAETTSIGPLKEMRSSATRPEGGPTDGVVERLSEKIVREIAWEVIPDVAELVIKQRIKELESGVE